MKYISLLVCLLFHLILSGQTEGQPLPSGGNTITPSAYQGASHFLLSSKRTLIADYFSLTSIDHLWWKGIPIVYIPPWIATRDTSGQIRSPQRLRLCYTPYSSHPIRGSGTWVPTGPRKENHRLLGGTPAREEGNFELPILLDPTL